MNWRVFGMVSWQTRTKHSFGVGWVVFALVAGSGILLALAAQPQGPLFIRPGLDFEILEVTIPEDRRPVVHFSIKDPGGLPLDRDGVFTPGPVSTTFVIGRIPQGEIQYLSYNSRFVTSPITGDTAEQATSESGGTYTKVEDGIYIYAFGNALPANYDQNVTHTIAAYARRDLTEFNLDRYVDNDVIHFVPSGVEVTQVRDVVVTEACYQ